jgi:hypothetical protein
MYETSEYSVFFSVFPFISKVQLAFSHHGIYSTCLATSHYLFPSQAGILSAGLPISRSLLTSQEDMIGNVAASPSSQNVLACS